ncbi:MAG: ATP-binding cassette domain-containing protein [Thermoplasmata archaeon]
MLKAYNISVKQGGFILKVERYETRGRRNFIIGENGSGKSTFLKAISGIIQIDSGEITVDGERVDDLPIWKRKVSYIPQNLLLFPHYTVKDNLLLSVRYGSGDFEIYRDLVKAMKLENILDRSIFRISGGESQRVAVARAIISKPKILLMDEPFSMQDERSRMSLISNLLKLVEAYDISYIYVTHNLRDLELGFDSLATLEAGRIAETVSSLDELKTYRSLSLLDYRNIVKIDGEFFKVNDEAVIENPGGYHCSCSFNGISYFCSVDIDGEIYFFTSSSDHHEVSFRKERCTRLL